MTGSFQNPKAAGRWSRRSGPIFYGWWIVAASVGFQILGAGLLMHAYGAYTILLKAEFGWSTTMLSFGFVVQRIESGLLGPVQGWLVDRFGPRIIMQVGVVVFGVGFMAFSLTNSPVTFFATFAIVAVGASLAGFLTLTVAIVNWFSRHRATALGLMGVGFSLGSVVFLAVAWSLESYGWRTTALVSGIIIIVVGTPLARLLRTRPEDYGLRVDGDPPEVATGEEDGPGSAAESDGELSFTAREALKTPQFWYLSIGHSSALLLVSAVMMHLVPRLHQELGYSLQEASIIVLVLTVFQMLGHLGGGFLGDRIDKRAIIIICMAMHCAAILILAYASSLWMILVFTLLHGSAWGVRGPLMQALRADYYGRGSFGTIMGFSSLIVMTGTIAGPLVAGYLFDVTGSYQPGFTLLAAVAGVGSLFFILATRPKPPNRQHGVDARRDLEGAGAKAELPVAGGS